MCSSKCFVVSVDNSNFGNFNVIAQWGTMLKGVNFDGWGRFMHVSFAIRNEQHRHQKTEMKHWNSTVVHFNSTVVHFFHRLNIWQAYICVQRSWLAVAFRSLFHCSLVRSSFQQYHRLVGDRDSALHGKYFHRVCTVDGKYSGKLYIGVLRVVFHFSLILLGIQHEYVMAFVILVRWLFHLPYP